eukprot:scaffold3127_cov202-Prasinococcus_capsulatus_cf.AAC.17
MCSAQRVRQPGVAKRLLATPVLSSMAYATSWCRAAARRRGLSAAQRERGVPHIWFTVLIRRPAVQALRLGRLLDIHRTAQNQLHSARSSLAGAAFALSFVH